MQPSAADGNHGRCAFAFKRTINTFRVNHTNKSHRGLEPKGAVKHHPQASQWELARARARVLTQSLGSNLRTQHGDIQGFCSVLSTPRPLKGAYPGGNSNILPCQPRCKGSVQRTRAKGWSELLFLSGGCRSHGGWMEGRVTPNSVP